MTIARRWRAVATPDGAAAYVRYFDGTLRAQLAALPGFRGALILVAEARAQARIEVITQWSSMDAVHRFAGERAETAVVEPEARALLVSWDEQVEHVPIALDTRDR
ncbi:MAG TPA: hypothetical protein VGG74_06015 [Kofleriaceae bacterium]|jgi:heme-degrading monooxygenase HmoA